MNLTLTPPFKIGDTVWTITSSTKTIKCSTCHTKDYKFSGYKPIKGKITEINVYDFEQYELTIDIFFRYTIIDTNNTKHFCHESHCEKLDMWKTKKECLAWIKNNNE